jgi:flagellar motor switch protein FliM
MADKLSPSEIESLLAAVRADSTVLPTTDEPIDEDVDFKSFDRNAIADSFFAELMQHTVKGLALALGLEMTVQSVEQCHGSPAETPEPSVTVKMTNLEADTWTLKLHSDLVLPMTAAALGAPLEDYQNRPERQLSFVERQLLEPLIHRAVHYLNEQRLLDSPLLIHDAEPSDISIVDESRSNCQPGQMAICTIHGINDQPFTGTLTFEVPAAVFEGQSCERPTIECDGSTLEVIVELTASEIDRSEVSGLEIGDLLMTEVDPSSLLTATIDGLPAYRGTMGIFQGRKALRITEKVNNRA